ncbi:MULTISPECIES: hypothetical protein [Oscillatoriales]|uniref:Uncharacterized protein n=4 Tax=Limnospira TaxID=2596745 RepID=A0A9P1P118_9CYAN|nr:MULTISPECIES: hypothetical protein [Oscillatoriales]EKD09260.1 hypothetical protein SPLC1_S206620 [Arthrospira platensis C1]MBD2671345.1 hypothetical protein [Arthrospira platensis FACHB-439]MBD2712222.1 hypothetical protein [Arthrospira platensis FACHB-835]MDC0838112.1 hypothetical protein [Limnoraphis robusta]MDF2212134.1 hypothetical protein [Arthrospira platensis NCB002]MDT9185434.1 hypothetical protein [Limnospira sp. PMC 289.06]MDT9190023.1 hypothetical protein [Limnospira sp. PMC 8
MPGYNLNSRLNVQTELDKCDRTTTLEPENQLTTSNNDCRHDEKTPMIISVYISKLILFLTIQ